MNAAALLLLATTAVKAIPQAAVDRPQVLASFESDKAHGARWQAVNDPVMGGISESSFKVEGNRGVWSGEVKVVPRLHAPGFCRVNGALSAGPTDLSQSAGLIFDVSGTGDPAETMMAQIETGRSNFRGQFVANVTGISAETGSHFVAFSDFRPFGIRPEAGGPPTADQLKHVTQVGFLADGTKGKFKIELGEVSAGSAAPSPAPAPSAGGLSLFEFSTSSKPWRVTDDPVMGGVSHSAFKVIDGVGVWVGEVKTVPKLQAPGTCQANSATFASADASSYDAIEIKLISKAELKQFQSSWTGPFVPEPPHSPFYRSHAYKAPFNVTGTGAVETIVLPMTAYTSSYSTFTGECTDHSAVCCTPEHPEVCPSSKTQSSITEVGIDAQGTDGKFNLEIISIRAIKQGPGPSSCTGASVSLAADQCAAWGEFWDGAGGPNWAGKGQDCSKSDPCGTCRHGVECGPKMASSNCSLSDSCDSSITEISLFSSNLAGTISSAIGAFVDMESFSVAGHPRLTGSLPASMSAWKQLNYFSVNDCHLDGALPVLNYHAFAGGGPKCVLCGAAPFNRNGCQGNAFSCPFPQGVTDTCRKFNGDMSYQPITNADCYNSTASE